MMTLRQLASGQPDVPATVAWALADIGEARGKQELFTRQSPQRLKVLRDHALVESAVSSNRIEGVTIEQARVRPVLIGKGRLRDRDEEEVRGYRDALRLIHERNAKVPVSEKATVTSSSRSGFIVVVTVRVPRASMASAALSISAMNSWMSWSLAAKTGGSPSPSARCSVSALKRSWCLRSSSVSSTISLTLWVRFGLPRGRVRCWKDLHGKTQAGPHSDPLPEALSLPNLLPAVHTGVQVHLHLGIAANHPVLHAAPGNGAHLGNAEDLQNLRAAQTGFQDAVFLDCRELTHLRHDCLTINGNVAIEVMKSAGVRGNHTLRE